MVTRGAAPAPGPLRQQGGQQVVADGLAGPEVQLAAWLGIGAEELLYLRIRVSSSSAAGCSRRPSLLS